MKKTTKAILRNVIMIVASILVIMVTSNLIASTIKFIDYSLQLDDIQNRANSIGWTDKANEEYNALINERLSWTQGHDFRAWLISCSSSNFGGLLRVIIGLIVLASFLLSILILIASIFSICKIVRAFIIRKTFKFSTKS